MIILTGGAGFIGSCFLRKLNDEGINDILVVDHLGSSEKWKNLTGKKFVKYLNKFEFRNVILNRKLDCKIDAIVHFGACSDTTERDADYILDNNYNYSIELAEFAAEKDIRFIYASSAATYGDGSNGYSDSNFDGLVPLNVYGMSKHLFDLWVIQKKLDKQFAGFKFFNVFGPNEYHKGKMASMIYKSYYQVLETGMVKLFRSNSQEFKDGEQKRDFVYIKDIADIIWDTLNDRKIGGIFNLGTSCARSWNDLANAVFAAMKREPNIQYIDMPDNLQRQYQNFTEADMSKLKAFIPDMKFASLEENAQDYIIEHIAQNNKIY